MCTFIVEFVCNYINRGRCKAIDVAIRFGIGIKAVQILLKSTPDFIAKFNRGNYNLLHSAVLSQQDVDIIKMLLEYGADANMTSTNGETPLNITIQTNNVEITRLLLKHEADATRAGIQSLQM